MLGGVSDVVDGAIECLFIRLGRFGETAQFSNKLKRGRADLIPRGRRQEVMQGILLVDRPFPDEPSLETIRDNLLIGDVETVAEKLIGEIRATHPVHICFSFKVGNTEHRAAMRSMRLA